MKADDEVIFRKLVSALGVMDEGALTAFASLWEEITVARRQILTREGETEKYLYLTMEGVQRAYCLYNDKEATLVFSYPYSFSGVVDSFFLQQPSRFYLEAITRSRMLRMRYCDMDQLMQQHPQVETWVRIAVTRVLAETLQRQIELIAYSAEDKFTTLLRRSPHILNLIPHKYLASYIGVDATNFSKLLGRIRIA